jgi:porin
MIREGLSSACLKAAAAAGAFAGSPALAESERGLRFGATYTSDNFTNVDGGLESGFSYMGLLEITAEAKGKALGIDALHAFASVQHVHGRSLSAKLVGDAQVGSNIDAPAGLRLFEAWVSVPVGRVGYIKAGLIDLNGEFDVQDVGALFVNSSHGIGPDFSQSGLNGPSIFPTTSAAIMAGVTSGQVSIRAGLFDAVSGDPERPRRTIVRFPGDTGLLAVAEAEIRMSDKTEIQVGAWRYTSKFETIREGTRERGNHGAYVMVQSSLGSVVGQPVDGWVRVGTADTRFNAISTYVGGGLAAGPDSRRFGVAIAHARLGSRSPDSSMDLADDAETIVELTYAHAIGDRLTVQPDVMYVINPGFERRLQNALVAGVRIQLSLF